jgi:DNA-binding NarL/FixJ family response regulator
MPHAPSVTLSEDERAQLWAMAHWGKSNTRALRRAQVLLKVADGWTAAEIAEAFDVSASTVANACRRWREGGDRDSRNEKVLC